MVPRRAPAGKDDRGGKYDDGFGHPFKNPGFSPLSGTHAANLESVGAGTPHQGGTHGQG